MTDESFAIKNGIFVQQVHRTTAGGQKPAGYCVTFPRLDDSGSLAVFPSQTYRVFSEALRFARQYKACDSRMKRKPIYVLQESWRKGFRGTRLLQHLEW